MKYRKKPVVIEAIQYKNLNDMIALRDTFGKEFERVSSRVDNFDHSFEIFTLEGPHRVTRGDYIIKGVKGEFYPCKPDIFEVTYELVE